MHNISVDELLSSHSWVGRSLITIIFIRLEREEGGGERGGAGKLFYTEQVCTRLTLISSREVYSVPYINLSLSLSLSLSRERERERERETDRQTDRQTDREGEGGREILLRTDVN